MTFTQVTNKIATLLASNFNRLISASKHRDVANSMVQAISENVGETQIPVMNGDQFVGYATLQFDSSTGELKLGEIRLGTGATRVNQIYDTGTFSGDKHKALITYDRALRIRRVIGIVAQPIDIGTDLVIGQTLVLEGGINHTIVNGDSFLLKSQTDPSENKPYTINNESYNVASWHEPSITQIISVDKGSTPIIIMLGTNEDNSSFVYNSGLVKTIFFDNETLTIPEGYEYSVSDNIEISGEITIIGHLIIN